MRVFLQPISGESEGARIFIRGQRFVIGRAADCDLRAHSDLVGAHHCQVMVEPTGVLLQDLNSRNGTFVDGQRVAGMRVLHDGARLRIGPLDLQVTIVESDATQAPETVPDPIRESTVCSIRLRSPTNRP